MRPMIWVPRPGIRPGSAFGRDYTPMGEIQTVGTGFGFTR